MVDPAPNLRNLIAEGLYVDIQRRWSLVHDEPEVELESWDGTSAEHRESYLNDADAVLAVLKRHPQAVLNLLGTVREGFISCEAKGDPAWTVYPDPDPYPVGEHGPVFVVSLGAAAKEAGDESAKNNEGKATT